MTKVKGKRYLPIGEAAEYAGLSVQQVRRYFDAGVFEGYQTLGEHRQISLESLEKFSEDPKGVMQRARWRRMQEQGKVIGTTRVLRRI
jgi:excisionase family DNA binding protein